MSNLGRGGRGSQGSCMHQLFRSGFVHSGFPSSYFPARKQTLALTWVAPVPSASDWAGTSKFSPDSNWHSELNGLQPFTPVETLALASSLPFFYLRYSLAIPQFFVGLLFLMYLWVFLPWLFDRHFAQCPVTVSQVLLSLMNSFLEKEKKRNKQ